MDLCQRPRHRAADGGPGGHAQRRGGNGAEGGCVRSTKVHHTLFKLLGLMVILFSFAGGWLAMDYRDFKASPLPIPAEGYRHIIPPGTSVTRLAADLQLADEGAQRDPAIPLRSPYEALILAAIIEKETGVADERPQIAGVFTRRLIQSMRLQTDPTVIYALGLRYDGNIHRADLLTDSPYNTYLYAGLPPTPIALPGLASLRAALHPAPGDSLFFVSRGDGSHVFSATLEQHNEAVRRYQLLPAQKPSGGDSTK